MTEAELLARIQTLQSELAMLISAVNRYLSDPGCNIQSAQTAMAKLRWSAEEAQKRLF